MWREKYGFSYGSVLLHVVKGAINGAMYRSIFEANLFYSQRYEWFEEGCNLDQDSSMHTVKITQKCFVQNYVEMLQSPENLW